MDTQILEGILVGVGVFGILKFSYNSAEDIGLLIASLSLFIAYGFMYYNRKKKK